MTYTHEPNSDHKHQFDGLTQSTILDKADKPEYKVEVVDGVRKKVRYVPRILGFEKFCVLCGLIEDPIAIGGISTASIERDGTPE